MSERYVVVAEFGSGELLGAMTCSLHLTAENEEDAVTRARASKWGDLIADATRLTARKSSFSTGTPQALSTLSTETGEKA